MRWRTRHLQENRNLPEKRKRTGARPGVLRAVLSRRFGAEISQTTPICKNLSCENLVSEFAVFCALAYNAHGVRAVAYAALTRKPQIA